MTIKHSYSNYCRRWPVLFYALYSFPLLLGHLSLALDVRDGPKPRSSRIEGRDSNTVPLQIWNNCGEIIYPGITTDAGTAPEMSGFQLKSGENMSLTVGSDWQGRVWGRTNCSFNTDGTGPFGNGGINGGGQACATGDCNGIVNCMVTGNTPVTLAEFTLASSTGQTFYDISLVDGYNLPLAIVSIAAGNTSIADIPPNLTNPICIGTAGLLAGTDWDPYDGYSDFAALLGTNSSFPLPFDDSISFSDVSQWCPWDLQLEIPTEPSDGVYSYPDSSIERPGFDPCYSACAKYDQPSDCCTGEYDSPNSCQPSAYSQAAKMVCPDAYSYAFDDQTSTFIIPSGGGFGVIFCPEGRSTDILATSSSELHRLFDTSRVYSTYSGAINEIAVQSIAVGDRRSTRKTLNAWSLIITIAIEGWRVFGM